MARNESRGHSRNEVQQTEVNSFWFQNGGLELVPSTEYVDLEIPRLYKDINGVLLP